MKRLCIFLVFLFVAFNLCAQQTDIQKTTAAVMDLEAQEGVSAGVAKSLSDYLRVQLVNTQKFDIVTRENMDDVLKEQQFQLSNCTSKECVVKVGQLLGVRKMFAGVVTKIGATYVVTLKIIDVQSGKIGKAETEKCANCEEDALLVSMENIANKIAGLPVQSGIVPQAVQPIQVKTKEITWQKDNSVMVFVPEGEFLMGSPEGKGDTDEHSQHKIYLDEYYIDKYEITNQQFKKFIDLTGYRTDAEKGGGGWVFDGEAWKQKISASWKDPFGDGTGISSKMSHPVVQVSWNDAVAYTKWAGKRLPTEAEWEKACRASSTTTYCFGNDESKLGEYAWYSANSSSKIHPAGEKKPNASGIYDMPGNVWEWCFDWYNENYYKDSPYKNPQGPNSGSYRVIRGGSWFNDAGNCHSTDRFWSPQLGRWNIGGFRCVVTRTVK